MKRNIIQGTFKRSISSGDNNVLRFLNHPGNTFKHAGYRRKVMQRGVPALCKYSKQTPPISIVITAGFSICQHDYFLRGDCSATMTTPINPLTINREMMNDRAKN